MVDVEIKLDAYISEMNYKILLLSLQGFFFFDTIIRKETRKQYKSFYKNVGLIQQWLVGILVACSAGVVTLHKMILGTKKD